MAKYSHAYGGVGAPVGLTVFKTAGGSLGAVPGGFDSHTPLPKTFVIDLCAFYCNRGIDVNSIISVEKVRHFVAKASTPNVELPVRHQPHVIPRWA